MAACLLVSRSKPRTLFAGANRSLQAPTSQRDRWTRSERGAQPLRSPETARDAPCPPPSTTVPSTTPDAVLNRLHYITSKKNPIRVLGANRFSIKVNDCRRIEIGKNVFVHRDAPRGWVEEWSAFVASGQPMGLMTARMCLAPFTWTELCRMLEPVGMDRWPFELASKYGMRDGLTCPVGGRWVLAYWSRKVLSDILSPEARALVFMASSFRTPNVL